MSGQYQEPFPLRRMVGHPVFWGVVGSIGVGVLAVWMGMSEDCGLTGGITGSCATKAEQFLSSKPHEMAAVVTSIAAALGVVWLMVLVWVRSRR